MFKKLIFCGLILMLSLPLFGQQGLSTVQWNDFNFDIDSTSTATYTLKKVFFQQGAGNKVFTAGTYSLYTFFDSTAYHKANTDSVTIGDSDSLYIYVKPLMTNETSEAVDAIYVTKNDSLFLTPLSSTTGFNFDMTFTNNDPYVWEFDLPRCAGVAIYLRWASETGAMNIRYLVTR